MSKRDRKRKEQDRRKAVAMQQTKSSKTDLSATTIGPATATLILNKRHERRLEFTLLPCSRCGQRGRVGDIPTVLTLAGGKRWSICNRFERATGELICKQCMNEIGYSDDPAEDDKWLAETIARNEARLTIMRGAGMVFPGLEKLYPSVREEADCG